MNILSEILESIKTYRDEAVSYNQKGYIGNSMSVRAKQAYNNGEKPKSKWSKSAMIDALSEEFGDVEADGFKKISKDKLFDGIMKKSSWHHTGKFATETDFYSIDRKRAISFAEENNIDSMSEVISEEEKNEIKSMEKEKEREKKAQDEFQKRKEKLKKDMDEFINNVKYTVTEPEELSNGTWLITFASNETDNAKRRYNTYEDAKTVYDRLMLGMKDPDIDKDDFWERMFYTDRY